MPVSTDELPDLTDDDKAFLTNIITLSVGSDDSGLEANTVDSEDDHPSIKIILPDVIYLHTQWESISGRQAELMRMAYPAYDLKFYSSEADDRKAFAVGYMKEEE